MHEFPPNEFICEMHHQQFIKFTEGNKDLVSQCYRDGTITDISKYDGETDIGQFCWEYINDINKIDLKNFEDIVKQVPFKCGTYSDITIQKDTDYKILEPNTVSRSDMFNANYLVGKTAVCIILPESVGNTENWTTLQQDTAIAQIVLAYDKLTNKANDKNIDVTWVYEIHRSVPVDEEPIEHERPSLYTPVPYILNWGWMDDVLEYLGSGGQYQGLFSNANRLRREYKTDWGLTFFMAKNATQVSFPNNALGYTRPYWIELTTETFRAPFAVSVYYRSGVTYLTHRIVMHETLHIFGAADEYYGAATCGGNWWGIPYPPADCDHGHGFLSHYNLNCEECTSTPVSCIMKSTNHENICEHTLKHIGWSDSDGDSHPDAIDLNNNLWSFFESVQPGDIVRAFTLTGNLIRNIAVTDRKMATYSGGTCIFYDCLNYQSQEIAYGQLYYYVVNNGEPQFFATYLGSDGDTPIVNSVNFSNDTLSWRIDSSLCYLDLELWWVNPCTGEEEMVAKPQWNQFQLSSDVVPIKKQDISNIDCDPCIARFKPWRPDGMNGPVVEYEFSTTGFLSWDMDKDSIGNDCDNCPYAYNPYQYDSDFDGIGDSCEIDCFNKSEWQRTYDWFGDDLLSRIRKTPDSAYIIVSTSKSDDITLCKITPCGNPLWFNIYGGSNDEEGMDVEVTSDGGYIICGYSLSYGAGGSDIYLVRTDSLGDTLWTKTYGGEQNEVAYAVEETADLGFIVVAYTQSYGAGYYDFWVLKTDQNGNTLWTKTFGGTGYDFPRDVIETVQGDFVIAGYTDSYGVGFDAYLLKINSSGDSLWAHKYGGVGYEMIYDLEEKQDGNGYVLVGYMGAMGTYKFYTVCTDTEGNLEWERNYGGPDGYDMAYSVCKTLGNQFLVAGYTESSGAGEKDYWVVCLDALTGDSLWSKTYGGVGIDIAYDILESPDIGYIVVGTSASFDSVSTKSYNIKEPGCCTGMTGNADCSELEDPDISDIIRITDYLYLSHSPLCCPSEADVNADGTIDISDQTALIDFLYLSHTPLATCP